MAMKRMNLKYSDKNNQKLTWKGFALRLSALAMLFATGWLMFSETSKAAQPPAIEIEIDSTSSQHKRPIQKVDPVSNTRPQGSNRGSRPFDEDDATREANQNVRGQERLNYSPGVRSRVKDNNNYNRPKNDIKDSINENDAISSTLNRFEESSKSLSEFDYYGFKLDEQTESPIDYEEKSETIPSYSAVSEDSRFEIPTVKIDELKSLIRRKRRDAGSERRLRHRHGSPYKYFDHSKHKHLTKTAKKNGRRYKKPELKISRINTVSTDRIKRYSYIDSNGVLRYSYYPLNNCCDYLPPGCNYPSQAFNPPRVQTSYGPWSKDWRGLKHGCNCNERGSEIKSCDIKTGQCRCLPHVVGLTCDRCEAGYWGLNSGTGCSKCLCDPLGTFNGACDDSSGKCLCKPGIGGVNCDTCLPNYYGFSSTGCLQCEDCLLGQICDPDTGRCICPPLAQGPGCRECRPGSWGLVPYKGCKYCNCSALGSTFSKCDPRDGKCTCREGYAGSRCDTCAPKHYGYPRCRPCACHYPGTLPTACDAENKCYCDENGKCPCRLNVVGPKCNECKNGTFGLSVDSPSGCTQCFCFGRSSHCTEAGLTWGQLRLYSPRLLRIRSSGRPSPFGPAISFISITKVGELPLDLYSEDQNLSLNMTSGVTIIPDTEGNVTIETNYDLMYPLYWELPKKFLGDRVTSYGGLLKFKIDSFGESDMIPPHILKDYPLIQLHAQGVLILEYHEKHPISSHKVHQIRFHESLWTLRSTKATTSLSPSAGLAVDRMTLMVALQNVDAIFIRASHYTKPSEAKLSDVVMDTAIPVQGHPARLATSVELCSCPLQYNASSCQDASIGYFIPPFQFNNFSEDIITEIIGKAQPCQCNGRSETCDKDTGHCTNCRENTGGRHCETCAVGHHGDVNSFQGCQPCPCPHSARNHAASCQIRPGRVLCYCKTGYTGQDCSLCAPGWWLGNDGKCRACECNSGGVVRNSHGSSECHPATGQCPCRSHVTGMHCDLCVTPRHYLEESSCIPCDNCSQTLLDSIELMSYELSRDTDHIKNTSIPKPWVALYKLSNKTIETKDTINNLYGSVRKILSQPLSSFDDMKYKIEKLIHKSLKLSQNWNETAAESCRLKHDANLMFDDLMDVRKRLEDRIQELEDFSRHERHLNLNKVLKEARNMLKKIKNINLGNFLENANDIFEKGSLQSAIIYEYIYKIKDHENKIEALEKGFDDFHNKTDEINKFKEDTWDIVDLVEASVKRSKDKLNDILEKNVQSEAIHGDIIKLQDHHLNQESVVLLQEYQDDILNLMRIKPILANLTDRAKEKERILSRINPEYRDKYLLPAISHVGNLTSVALNYKNLFTETKNSSGSAIAASSAYKDIVQGIKAAQEAALQAIEASESAYKTTEHQKIMDGTEGPLLALSESSKSNSTVHYLRGLQQIQKVKDMSAELEKSRQKVERTRLTIREQAWNDKDIYANTTKLSSETVHNLLAIANNKSDRVYENMRALYKEADIIHKDALYKLRMKLQDLQNHGDDKIGGAEENVSLLRSNIRKAAELSSSLIDAAQLRVAEINRSNTSLAVQMQLLRDQIQRAKHAADGIRVSLQSASKNGCYRSYRLPNLSPSTTTRISATLALSPENTHDSVLFHLPSSTTGDFVKLEMINRKIRFTWNLGGDTAYILHPEKLESFTNIFSDYSWYRVDAERIWNVGKLYVSKVIPESPDDLSSPNVPASNSSNPAWGVFDVKSGDLAWIGSIGSSFQKNSGLAGCLSKIYFNNRQIGLWNFHSQPDKDSCKGCVEGADETSLSEHNMYYWNGAGYSVLKRSDLRPYNKEQFSILLTFKTFDENALLFLAVDDANNRSVSLQIREGRVVFRIDYAGESRLEINTTEKYNTGKLVQVQAARVFINGKIEKGSLNVDGTEQQGSPNPPVINSASLPDLIDSDYLLGGTPPLWKPSPNVHSLPPAFLGCLGELMIDEEGYNPMDSTISYGLESLCSTKLLASVGFYGDGFLELPAHTLRRKSNLGFMFRTLQPSAFLLLSSPHFYHSFRSNEVIPENLYTTVPDFTNIEDTFNNNEGSYSFALVEGRIHLLINAGKGDLKLVSNLTSLNDGLFHSISIVKNGRKIELFIDDIAQAQGSLPPGSVVVHARASANGESGGLFLGGVPEQLNDTDITDQHIASTISLRGAIKDVVIDGAIMSMNNVVSMNHALIGRLGPPMGEEFEIGANLLNTEQEESDSNKTSKGCHKVNSYTLEPGAVKFGDVANSYAQVHLTGRNIWMRDFTVEFDFRTFYPNGLLFMTPGTKEKQRHLIAVFLRDGKVTILMKGRKKRELSIPLVTNDGAWHHVIMRSIQKRLTVTVGPRSELTKLPRKLFLSNMLYVGGLPDRSVAIMIPEQMAKMEGFKGCIRRLNVNGKQEDLVKDAALHQNVGQCFPTIERGSYFPGDAYAIYKRQFVIGSHLELQLEFRTVEMNGVLLNIAHTSLNSPALSLELYNAKVVISVLTLLGRRFRVETSLPTQFGLCDNTWHNISALFSADELTVRVDQQPEETDVGTGPAYGLSTPPSINQPIVQTPLYIGGLPDGAPTGTLKTNDNFKGCIRNVSIRGHRKDWTDMDYLHNLLLSSCPVQ